VVASGSLGDAKAKTMAAQLARELRSDACDILSLLTAVFWTRSLWFACRWRSSKTTAATSLIVSITGEHSQSLPTN
jgi:hypothetical protein